MAFHVSPSVLTGIDAAKRGTDVVRPSSAAASALRPGAPLMHAKLREHFKLLLAARYPRA